MYADSRAPWEAECNQGGVLDPQSIGNHHHCYFDHHHYYFDHHHYHFDHHHYYFDHCHNNDHHKPQLVIANSDCPLEEFASIERVREGILSSLHDAVFFIRWELTILITMMLILMRKKPGAETLLYTSKTFSWSSPVWGEAAFSCFLLWRSKKYEDPKKSMNIQKSMKIPKKYEDPKKVVLPSKTFLPQGRRHGAQNVLESSQAGGDFSF